MVHLAPKTMKQHVLHVLLAVALLGALFAVAGTASAQDAEQSLNFTDQALSEEGTVIVEDVQSDGEESAIVITYEDESEEPVTEETNLVIAGLEVGTFDDENVAVAVENATGFPGDHTAHVVPVANLSSEYQIGDFVSVATAEEIRDNEAATVFDVELNFEAQSYEGETSEVVVETANLFDGAGDATEFVIDLHPTDGEGDIIGDQAVGQSDNLTGANSNVVVSLDEPLTETDDFVAMLHEGPSSEPLTTPPILTGAGDQLVPVVDAATVEVEQQELTFNDQVLADGEVTVEDVTSFQNSTIAVTYTDGDNETIAGLAAADNLDGEDVQVEIEDAGGFPGVHTAWLFDDDDVPDGVGIGDDATPIAGEALDSDSANVTEAEAPTGELTFNDQELADGEVTVEDVSTGQESTIAVTYTDGDNETIAGLAAADNLDGEDVQVEIEDAGGFPGVHTAWVFDDDDVPAGVGIGDDATPIAGDALDSDSAEITEAATGELTFNDQGLEDGEVTVENVSTGQESTVVITYTDGDNETIAGLAAADNLDTEDVQVEIEDAGGFPGVHTAWVFDNDDVPAGVGIGDDATPIAGDALDSETAFVSIDVTGDGIPARDTTGDGLLDDINGDNELTIADVQALFMNLDNPAVQNNAALFDFAGANPDRVNVFDVQGLFTQLQAPTGELTFNDQVLDDGFVTVEDVSTGQESTVAVTYTDGDNETIAGLAAADSLNNEDVMVEIEDADGFPGVHTAWIFDNDDVPAGVGIGDDATPIAGDALDSDSAEISAEVDEPMN